MSRYSLWPSKLYISEIQERKILERADFFSVAFAYSLLITFIGVIFVMSFILFLGSAESGGSVNDNPTSALVIPIALSAIAGYLVKGVPSLIAAAPQFGEARIEKLWERPFWATFIIFLLLALSLLGIFLAIGLGTNLTSSPNNSVTDLFLSFITGANPIDLPIILFFTIVLAGGTSLFATSLVLSYYIAYPWTKGLHASVRRFMFFPALKFGAKNEESAFKNRCPQCCSDEFEVIEFNERNYCSCNCCGLAKAQIKTTVDDSSVFYQIEPEERDDT